jgi:hypothetical protein
MALRRALPGHLLPGRQRALGGLLVTAAYGIWAQEGHAESSAFVNRLHGFGQLGMSIGYGMVGLFIQKTFHPDSRVARGVAWSLIALLAISLLGRTLHEGFAVGIDPGPLHWTGYACRMFALVWAAWAAFRYWVQMKKRARLGLADALVTNRFMLWGLWATGNFMTAFAEPIARLLYGWFTGSSAATMESIQGVGGPLITITLCFTSVLAMSTSVILFLAFFPSEGYRRWIRSRSAAEAS